MAKFKITKHTTFDDIIAHAKKIAETGTWEDYKESWQYTQPIDKRFKQLYKYCDKFLSDNANVLHGKFEYKIPTLIIYDHEWFDIPGFGYVGGFAMGVNFQKNDNWRLPVVIVLDGTLAPEDDWVEKDIWKCDDGMKHELVHYALACARKHYDDGTKDFETAVKKLGLESQTDYKVVKR